MVLHIEGYIKPIELSHEIFLETPGLVQAFFWLQNISPEPITSKPSNNYPVLVTARCSDGKSTVYVLDKDLVLNPGEAKQFSYENPNPEATYEVWIPNLFAADLKSKKEELLRTSVSIAWNPPKELARTTEPYSCQITGPANTIIHIETRSTLVSGSYDISTDKSGNGTFIIEPLLRMTQGPIVITASYEEQSVTTEIPLR